MYLATINIIYSSNHVINNNYKLLKNFVSMKKYSYLMGYPLFDFVQLNWCLETCRTCRWLIARATIAMWNKDGFEIEQRPKMLTSIKSPCKQFATVIMATHWPDGQPSLTTGVLIFNGPSCTIRYNYESVSIWFKQKKTPYSITSTSSITLIRRYGGCGKRLLNANGLTHTKWSPVF